MNVTRERIRQVEVKALAKLEALADAESLASSVLEATLPGKQADSVAIEDVGATMNITRERIRQVEAKALAKLDALIASEQEDLEDPLGHEQMMWAAVVEELRSVQMQFAKVEASADKVLAILG
jgi:DNA-directed RNA polymerase sigma subunit (sigma70/sigma32)